MQISVWRISNKKRTLQVTTQSELISSIVAEAGPRIAPEFKQFLKQPLDSLIEYVKQESKVNVRLLRDELNGD